MGNGDLGKWIDMKMEYGKNAGIGIIGAELLNKKMLKWCNGVMH